MTFPIDFQKKAIYPSLDIGITLRAILRYGTLQADCLAKVDTGSQFCLFERGVADDLEIDVKTAFGKSFQLSAAVLPLTRTKSNSKLSACVFNPTFISPKATR